MKKIGFKEKSLQIGKECSRSPEAHDDILASTGKSINQRAKIQAEK